MALGVGDWVLYARGRERLFGRIVSFHEQTGLWRIARYGLRENDWLTDHAIITNQQAEDQATQDVVRRDEIDGLQVTTFREPSGQPEPRWRYTVRVIWQSRHFGVSEGLDWTGAVAQHEAIVQAWLTGLTTSEADALQTIRTTLTV